MSQPPAQPDPSPSFLARLLASEKGLLLLVPFVGYLILFVFQAGYLSYFSIPWQFIGFQVTDILVAGVVIGVFLLVLLLLLWSILPLLLLLFHRLLSPAHLNALVRYLPLAVLALIALLYLYPWQRALFWITLGLSLAPLLLVLALQRNRSLRRAAGEVSDTWTGTWLGGYWSYLTTHTWLALLPLYLLLLLIVAHGAGHTVASQRAFFRVTNTTPEMVVVFQTEERTILSPFDRGARVLDASYLVLSTGDMAGILFRGETVGPLTVSEAALPPGPLATPVPLLPPPAD